METHCSIYETFKFAGCRVAHYESDLYVKSDPLSRRVVREMVEAERITRHPCLFAATDGSGFWYELPFAYDPWWEEKLKKVPNGR